MSRLIRVVGNSHVAAIMRGWDQLGPQYPDTQLEFFAAGSTLFKSLTLDADRRFGIHDPALYKSHHVDLLQRLFGALTVDLKACDAVLLVGSGFGHKPFLRAFSRFSIDGLRPRPGLPRLSAAAFSSFARTLARPDWPGSAWQGWGHPRLFVMPAPVPREDSDPADPRYADWTALAAEPGFDGPANRAFVGAFDRQLARWFSARGIGYIPPPEAVFGATGLTQAAFGMNRSRLTGDVEGKADDYHHMNAAYGALVLRDALAVIEGASERAEGLTV